jgi:hypothetical protein
MKSTISIILTQIIITLLATGVTYSYIEKCVEKHSVHPIYGNYIKLDSKDRKCQPWDSCK